MTGGGGVSSQPVDIPGYRIEGLLGRGGMGTVYRATDLRLGRTVAVKVLNPERAIDPDFRARFVDESRRAASIEHPNVLPVYEAGEAGGVLYIAMRLIEGSDLRELIAREGALDPERAARIVGQAAAGLDAAHARRLVHRDVKPANILMARPGRPDEHAYLTDFGLTKVVDAAGLTQTGEFVGTLDYIAPEQCRGEQVDGRADVYSLGCVLFEALTGRVPFPRASDVAKLYAHVSEPPPPPRAIVPSLSPALDAVVVRALSKEPAARQPSAGDLGRAATAALAGRAPEGPETVIASGAIAGGPPPVTAGPGFAAPGSPPVAAGPGYPRSGAPGPPPPRSPDRPTDPLPGGRRRRGPLIGALVALVAVLLAGGALAAVLLSGDDGGSGVTTTGSVARDTSPKSDTEPSTVTVTEPSSTQPDAATPAPPPQGGASSADREAIRSVLDDYANDFTAKDADALGGLMTADVQREGRGTPDCTQSGRAEVVEAYRSQFAQGSGPYSLQTSDDDIDVSGDTAQIRSTYSTSGSSDDIGFGLRREGEGWRFTSIDAVQSSC